MLEMPQAVPRIDGDISETNHWRVGAWGTFLKNIDIFPSLPTTEAEESLHLEPKNIPSKYQTSGGMTGRLGIVIYSNYCS